MRWQALDEVDPDEWMAEIKAQWEWERGNLFRRVRAALRRVDELVDHFGYMDSASEPEFQVIMENLLADAIHITGSEYDGKGAVVRVTLIILKRYYRKPQLVSS